MGARLTEDEAEAHIHGVCFKTGPPGRVGVELEWLVHDPAHPGSCPPLRRTAGLVPGDRLAHGGRLTHEPGGQLELSSRPADGLTACVLRTAAELDQLRAALRGRGLAVEGNGLEPFRDPSRLLEYPRYRAMERYFDRIDGDGRWGRMMMRATAGVQVNLESGADPAQQHDRWLLAHRIGPVLVAAFANSPLWQGSPSGWKSTRQQVWTRLDPGRTRPVATEGDAASDWARYALDAGVMCRPCGEEDDWGVPPGLTFRDWLRGGADGFPAPGPPDLDYHLTTLFPPIRPRGFLELRMIDAQPGPDGWIVPTLVAATLLDDPRAAAAAWSATEPLCAPGSLLPSAALWEHAARRGPTDPVLRTAALTCFTAVESALNEPMPPVSWSAHPGSGGPEGRGAGTGLSTGAAQREFGGIVARFAEAYLSRGRCPADDQLAALEGVA